MSLIDWLFRRPKGKMGAEEFDRLARDVYVSLREWVTRSTMLVAGGSQDEMTRKLRMHIDSFARQAPRLTDSALEGLHILDKRLCRRGKLVSACQDASRHLEQFRASVNGADWQKAMKKAMDAADVLESVRKKHLGSGFGGVSVTIPLP